MADIDELLAEADEIATEFHSALKGIVETYGGEYQQGPNKSRARAVEKIENDYGGLDQTARRHAPGIFS